MIWIEQIIIYFLNVYGFRTIASEAPGLFCAYAY